MFVDLKLGLAFFVDVVRVTGCGMIMVMMVIMVAIFHNGHVCECNKGFEI